MFSTFLEAALHPHRNARWDAPAHFRNRRSPVSNIERERAEVERRHREMRNIGMW